MGLLIMSTSSVNVSHSFVVAWNIVFVLVDICEAGWESGSAASEGWSVSVFIPSIRPESKKTFCAFCAISSANSLGEIFLLKPLNICILKPAISSRVVLF